MFPPILCNCRINSTKVFTIEQHMPESQKELHLIEDALEMRSPGNFVGGNVDFDGDKDESILEAISILKETLSAFEESIHSISRENLSYCKKLMQEFCHELRSVMLQNSK